MSLEYFKIIVLVNIILNISLGYILFPLDTQNNSDCRQNMILTLLNLFFFPPFFTKTKEIPFSSHNSKAKMYVFFKFQLKLKNITNLVTTYSSIFLSIKNELFYFSLCLLILSLCCLEIVLINGMCFCCCLTLQKISSNGLCFYFFPLLDYDFDNVSQVLFSESRT